MNSLMIDGRFDQLHVNGWRWQPGTSLLKRSAVRDTVYALVTMSRSPEWTALNMLFKYHMKRPAS